MEIINHNRNPSLSCKVVLWWSFRTACMCMCVFLHVRLKRKKIPRLPFVQALDGNVIWISHSGTVTDTDATAVKAKKIRKCNIILTPFSRYHKKKLSIQLYCLRHHSGPWQENWKSVMVNVYSNYVLPLPNDTDACLDLLLFFWRAIFRKIFLSTGRRFTAVVENVSSRNCNGNWNWIPAVALDASW